MIKTWLRWLCLSSCLVGLLGPVAYGESLENNVASVTDESVGIPNDVWERIRQGYGMPDLQSRRVDYWVRHYARNPEYFRRMTERAGQYLYHIVEEIENRNMPTELALLPFVESAFQPEALSVAKASGLWQFMPATGTDYSLTQNLWRDDRRDVLESTRAALDYFEYLYGMFGDWHLALAAYNWGEGSVQKAIKRAKARKQKADYAHLRMPKETANYVPKLMAIKRIISNPGQYKVRLPDVGNEPFFVTITKPRDIDTDTAAELANMPVNEFRSLNPSYKLPVIVASHNNVMLLPSDRIDTFIDNLASWMDGGQPLSQWTTYRMGPKETLAMVAKKVGMSESEIREVNHIPKGRQVLPHSTLLVRANQRVQQDIAARLADARLRLSPATTWRRVTYRVRSGDTISQIARRWHITQKSIITNNRLRSDRLRVGQRLILTVPNIQRASASTTNSRPTKVSHKIHVVRSGDTLSTIAERYGVGLSVLKRTNRIQGNFIKIGQRLRIPNAEESIDSRIRWHTVASGENLSTIAKKYGTSVVRIQRANRLNSTILRVGQRLEIPVAEAPARSTQKKVSQSKIHVVRSGDTLSTIAERYGVGVSQLMKTNGLRNKVIRVGQKLIIPAKVTTKKRSTSLAKNEYRVKSGDSLTSVAKVCRSTIRRVKAKNGLKSNLLRVGQIIRCP